MKKITRLTTSEIVGATLSSLCMGIVMLAVEPAYAAPSAIKVDNNGSSAKNPGAGWNVFEPVPGGPTSVVDTNGTDNGVTVTYSAEWGDSSQTGKEGQFINTVFANAADDYFWVKGQTGTVTISGLQNNELYTVRLCGSNNTGILDADYTVNGNFGDGSSPANGSAYNASLDGFTSGVIMTWTGVAPVSGDITISVAAAGTGSENYGMLNAFIIEGKFTQPAGTVISIK